MVAISERDLAVRQVHTCEKEGVPTPRLFDAFPQLDSLGEFHKFNRIAQYLEKRDLSLKDKMHILTVFAWNDDPELTSETTASLGISRGNVVDGLDAVGDSEALQEVYKKAEGMLSQKLPSDQLDARVKDLLKQGVAQLEIARRCGVSYVTITSSLERVKVSPRKKAWDTRGRVIDLVLPRLREGMSQEAIAEETGLDITQVRNARGHALQRGNLRSKETSLPPRIYQKDSTVTFSGKIHSIESILQMTEKRRGRELTELEILQIIFLVKARKITKLVGDQSVVDFFAESPIAYPTGWNNRAFVDTYYGLTVQEIGKSKLAEDELLDREEVVRIYEEIDSKAFTRMSKQVDFIDSEFSKMYDYLAKKAQIAELCERNSGFVREAITWMTGNIRNTADITTRAKQLMFDKKDFVLPKDQNGEPAFLLGFIRKVVDDIRDIPDKSFVRESSKRQRVPKRSEDTFGRRAAFETTRPDPVVVFQQSE